MSHGTRVGFSVTIGMRVRVCVGSSNGLGGGVVRMNPGHSVSSIQRKFTILLTVRRNLHLVFNSGGIPSVLLLVE